jgi:glycine cleavage system aminomethyltransferase T
MGYVPAASAAAGTSIRIDVRGKERSATVVPKPIYKREE